MGVLDYDCQSWTESGVFGGLGIVYLGIIVAGVREYRRSMRASIPDSTKHLFFLYFVTLMLGLSFRILCFVSGSHFIPFPAPIYGLFSTYPGLIFATACVFFMEYMIDSFYFNFGRARTNLHRAIRTFLVIFWPTELAMYVGVVYQHYSSNKINWYQIVYLVALAMYFIVTSLLVFLFVVYIRNIKRFPHTYRDKRCILLAMLIITTLQIVYRVVHILLDNFKIYNALQKACANSGVPCMHLMYDCYFLLCDITLPVVYTLYIRKDIQHLAMSEQGQLVSPKTTHKPNYASILESWIANLPQTAADPLLSSSYKLTT
jgi:hypothetical protein